MQTRWAWRCEQCKLCGFVMAVKILPKYPLHGCVVLPVLRFCILTYFSHGDDLAARWFCVFTVAKPRHCRWSDSLFTNYRNYSFPKIEASN